MNSIDLEKIHKIYFVGIAGIAMSACASIAKKMGFEVLGSDQKVYEPSLSVLENEDIPFFSEYSVNNVEQNPADLYVLSSGEDEQNPEVAWLIEHGCKIISFPELLALLSTDKIRIVVGGTHGKSTTSAWLGHILKSLDDSSFMVGAVLPQYQSNFYLGSGHYFVFEGDEYKSLYDDPTPKMKYYKADLLLLNNLELDHPDIYSSIDEIKNEFADCIENLPDDGVVVYNADSANLNQIVYPSGVRSFTFGIENSAHVRLLKTELQNGLNILEVENKLNPEDIRKETYVIKLFGTHNVYNALGVITTLRVLGFQPEAVASFLTSFEGLKRRFEYVEKDKYIIIDDYAHHPTAVLETLSTAKALYPDRKIWAVFEPHTYSRTLALLPEIAKSFESADHVLLAPIYSAREHAQIESIKDEDLLREVQKNHSNAQLVQSKEQAEEILTRELQPGDVVVVMSVGNFNQLAYSLKGKLAQK